MIWVDDPADPKYNTLVSVPYSAHGEHMWREDGVYDLLVVIGYNTGPIVPGLGSAIFLHIARPNFSPKSQLNHTSYQSLPTKTLP